ncbi:unnamed protein product [Hermetia illucens]|uniref:Uncharacterized protein n=1 Tax=Hermetia illucens TaxID=343691 RepID=A0A7R8YMA7_HERIL|nr:unnamed protein product [Hermetia illucens]
MNWKIANISFQNFDAIIGMDILVALGASIDISRSELKINGNVIPFGTDIPTQIIQEFSNAIDNIETQIDQQPDPNTHSIEEVELIEKIKNEFHDLEYDSNKKLTFNHEIKHTFKFKTGEPIYQRTYRLSFHTKDFTKIQIKEDLAQGIIQSSSSPYNSPVLVVPKKGDTYRSWYSQQFSQYLSMAQEKIDKLSELVLNNQAHTLHRNILSDPELLAYELTPLKLEHIKTDILIEPHKLVIFVEIPLELAELPIYQIFPIPNNEDFQLVMDVPFAKFISKTSVIYPDGSSLPIHDKCILSIITGKPNNCTLIKNSQESISQISNTMFSLMNIQDKYLQTFCNESKSVLLQSNNSKIKVAWVQDLLDALPTLERKENNPQVNKYKTKNMDFKTITAHISSLPNFMGDQHDLHIFIGSIDSIQKMIQTFSEDQQTLINYQIMGKLLGKPKEVVNALPSTQWTSIKGALLLHFDEPESESRLMEKILAAQFTTPAELYEYVSHNRRYPLDKPFIMSTIHKKEEIRYGLKTEFPSEFRTKHYIGWKLIDFVSNTFDCIIGQNALSGTQAILDFSKNIITINNISLSFIQEGENYSMIANEVSNILNKESSEIPEISVNPNNETNYTTEENLMIERIKDEFADIQYDKHKKLTFTHEIKHELKLTTSEPIYQQNYRYPYFLRDFVKRQIKEDLEQGIIVPSKSPYNSPVWVVPKKSNEHSSVTTVTTMGDPSSGTKRRKTIEEVLEPRDASEDELAMSSDIHCYPDEADEVSPRDVAHEHPEEDDVQRLRSENRMLLTLIVQQKEQIFGLN